MIKAVIFDLYETLITHYNTPLYFGTEIAREAGMETSQFLGLWRDSEWDRSVGKVSLQEVLTRIFKDSGCYSEPLVKEVVQKRADKARQLYQHLHPEIVPMLEFLRQQGVLIGMISNCYPEEAEALRKSQLAPYFDGVCLSCELGMAKPDRGIFEACLKALTLCLEKRQALPPHWGTKRRDDLLKPEECLYVGDGGSQELETARQLGMQTLQAAWYLREGSSQPAWRKEGFRQAETPMDIPGYVAETRSMETEMTKGTLG